MAKYQPNKKRGRRYIPQGRVYIKSSFNNTIITITDPAGNTLAQSSCGAMGFKGTKKSSAFAASKAAVAASKVAQNVGMTTVDIFVRGPGSGREAAMRSVQASGLKVTNIQDVTPIPHNGCRRPKRRRI